MKPTETWKPIGQSRCGRKKYYISDWGRCMTITQKTGDVKIDHGAKNHHTGYRTFAGDYVHRHVCAAFLKNPDPERCTEIHHRDSNRENNTLANLMYESLAGNRARRHAIRMRKQNATSHTHEGQIIKAVSASGKVRFYKNGTEAA